MSISKTRIFIKIIIPVYLILTACSGVPAAAPLASGPEWLRTPPASDDCIYGIGCAGDEITAKQLALVNAAQQFSTHVKSTLIIRKDSNAGSTGDVLSSFDGQITDYTVRGAKFIEKYADEANQIWILAEAPLDCLLDGTENLLISYMLTSGDSMSAVALPQPEENTDENRSSYIASLREFRKNMRNQLGKEIDKMLNLEAMADRISSSGYITPGFVIGYNTNNATSGAAPSDKTLYSRGDYGFIPEIQVDLKGIRSYLPYGQPSPTDPGPFTGKDPY